MGRSVDVLSGHGFIAYRSPLPASLAQVPENPAFAALHSTIFGKARLSLDRQVWV